jgi:hypothetical protein
VLEHQCEGGLTQLFAEHWGDKFCVVLAHGNLRGFGIFTEDYAISKHPAYSYSISISRSTDYPQM